MQELIRNIPDRKVSGVYALIDEDDKMYIGSSTDIRTRMMQHNSALNRVLNSIPPVKNTSLKLAKAVLDGHTFECRILKECDPSDVQAIRACEHEYYMRFGEKICTYNARGELPSILSISQTHYLNQYRCSGIYSITNTRNFKTLLCQSANIRNHVINSVFRPLITGKFHISEMQHDYDSGDDLKFDVISIFDKEISSTSLTDETLKFAYLIGRDHLYNHNITDNLLMRGKQYLEKHPDLFG